MSSSVCLCLVQSRHSAAGPKTQTSAVLLVVYAAFTSPAPMFGTPYISKKYYDLYKKMYKKQ